MIGICEKERVLTIPDGDPVKELSVSCGRQWGSFLTRYRTENQDPGIEFVRLNEIGYEPYPVLFSAIRYCIYLIYRQSPKIFHRFGVNCSVWSVKLLVQYQAAAASLPFIITVTMWKITRMLRKNLTVMP